MPRMLLLGLNSESSKRLLIIGGAKSVIPGAANDRLLTNENLDEIELLPLTDRAL